METSNNMYLVTGAAGFLGSNICMQLVARGERVRALVLPGDRYARFLPDAVEQCEGDLTDPASIERFMQVPDGAQSVMIHCGSMVSVSPDYNPVMERVNVTGTENIIRAVLAHKECRKMVYVGSTGSIPEKPKGELIREVDHYDPDQVVGWYSKTKAMAAQKVLDAVHSEGLNACIVHPTGIMGPNDHSMSTTTATAVQILQGKMPMGMQGSFNMVDVRDLAAGCIAAADLGRIGESYILGNEVVTLKELVDYWTEGSENPVRAYLPLGLARIIASLSELNAKITGKKPLLTSFSVYNLARNNAFDSGKAARELGYSTRSYRQTAVDQVAFLRQNGLI